MTDFTAVICHHALSTPDQPAIILADRVATYGMIGRGMMSVEARLATLDLKPGALVAVAIDLADPPSHRRRRLVPARPSDLIGLAHARHSRDRLADRRDSRRRPDALAPGLNQNSGRRRLVHRAVAARHARAVARFRFQRRCVPHRTLVGNHGKAEGDRAQRFRGRALDSELLSLYRPGELDAHAESSGAAELVGIQSRRACVARRQDDLLRARRAPDAGD